MADPREPYGRIFHEQGRVTVNAEREKPFGVGQWKHRTPEQREIDMRGASAVAAEAVRDAGLEAGRMQAQLFAFAAHMPAIRRALTMAAAEAEYEAEAKQYRAAIRALGIQDRGDEEGSASPVAAELAPPEKTRPWPYDGPEGRARLTGNTG